MKDFLYELKTQLMDLFRPIWHWGTHHPPLTVGHKLLAVWLISFLAWIMETVYCSALASELVDRGLLLLPFCPIYGITIGVIEVPIGTPLRGGVLMGKIKPGIQRFVLYFFLATLIPTVAEFLTGLFFDGLFGVRLWYYENQPFTLMGYVCLQVSILWGVMLTAFMLCLYPFVEKIVSMVKVKTASVISVVTTVLVVLNLGFFFIRILT